MTVLTQGTDRAETASLSIRDPYPKLRHFPGLLPSLQLIIQDLDLSTLATVSDGPEMGLCHCSSPPLLTEVCTEGGSQ